jgi:ABC-type phosphate/phosphonate transport system substrate-binding protein
MKWRRLTFVLILALVWSGVSATTALSQERTSIQFLSVAPDEETQKADQKLLDYLRGKIPLTFEGQDLKYEAAVDTLRNWDANKQGPLLARVTPYVYVVAEMLGANMEVVGIYLSKKSKRVTSNHYFVVHKDFGYEREEAPEEFVRHVNNPETQTQDFVQLLKQREFQARFVYPSRYSTSGHFLPSLFFKKQGIFALPSQSKTNPKYITIHGLVPESAMTVADLIPLVKKQKIDFVAVRESIKNRFEADEDLKFIQLPYTTPNDLLVVIKPFYPAIKTQILEALRKMEVNAIDQGDILKWVDFNASPKARKSLANLRRLAKAIPHPVVINIRKSQKENTGIEEQHLEAARQAVRSAGPEMVLFNEDDHSAFDVLWTLDTKHDHSLQLTSTILDSGLTQEFSVVYRQGDMQHLAAQISRVIEQKMHRIRYVWLMDDDTPRVLRDVDFQIPVGQQLKVQKITWLNFNTNEYNVDTPFNVKVTQSDFHSFQLEGKGLPKREDGKYGFEPLGNVAYRVFLERAPQAGDAYKLTTKVLIGLFGLAALFALVEVIIRPKTPDLLKEES